MLPLVLNAGMDTVHDGYTIAVRIDTWSLLCASKRAPHRDRAGDKQACPFWLSGQPYLHIKSTARQINHYRSANLKIIPFENDAVIDNIIDNTY